MKKKRADQLVVELGLAETRAKAQAFIMAGQIFCGEKRVEKSGDLFAPDVKLTQKGEVHPWVSRGGMKLAHGLDHFSISAQHKICMDIGASTGGFTDVLLTKGASKVYAVDVGHGQLDIKLRNDNRVICLERQNARYLTQDLILDPIDLLVCDASFISLSKVLETPLHFVKEKGLLIALIKPQFEVGKGQVGKGGVVRDPMLHQESVDRVKTWLEHHNWNILGVEESPIQGPKGNKEFLIAASLA